MVRRRRRPRDRRLGVGPAQGQDGAARYRPGRVAATAVGKARPWPGRRPSRPARRPEHHARAGGGTAPRAGTGGRSRKLEGHMDANALRRAFTHVLRRARATPLVPSSGLIPHHPRAPLFTNAGMNQFIPYFLGEERPPYPAGHQRPEVRADPGQARRHRPDRADHAGISPSSRCSATSASATTSRSGPSPGVGAAHRVLGLDGDRLWVSVYRDRRRGGGDLARDQVGMPGRADPAAWATDNFWEMGETGPCGPCSEIYYDRGPSGDPTAARRAAEARSASSSSGTWCSCSTTARPTGPSSPLPEAQHRHRRRPRARPDRSCRTCRPSGRPTSLRPIIARGRGAHRPDLRRRRRGRRGPADPGRPRPVRCRS